MDPHIFEDPNPRSQNRADPWLVQDIEVLEKVQRRAVNMIVGLTGRTYEDKLSEVNLTSLSDRRIKFDPVQT